MEKFVSEILAWAAWLDAPLYSDHVEGDADTLPNGNLKGSQRGEGKGMADAT